MTTVFYFFTIREIGLRQSALSNQIEKLAQNVATLQLVDQQEWPTYQAYINQLMDTNRDIIYIAVYDERNSLRAHTLNSELVELDRPVTSQRVRAKIVEQLDKGLVADESQDDIQIARVNIMVTNRIIGSVHVGFSLININDKLKEGIVYNLILATFFTIIFSLAAFFISRRLAYPLEQLNEAILNVTQGNLAIELKPQTHDEIADLVVAFNTMIINMRERRIIDTLGHELSATFQLEELAVLVGNRLKSAINASTVHLYVVEQDNPNMFRQITNKNSDSDLQSFVLDDKSSLKYLIDQKNGFIINEASDSIQNIFRLNDKKIDGLVIPLIVKEKIIGVLLFTLSTEKNTYTEKEKNFALTLSSPTGLALENALLYDELREQERMKRELEIAREVQQKLLPKTMPQIHGFEIEGICNSAAEVGGDYYDFFNLNDNKLGIVIADVSGKGTSASFYMAQLKGMMLQSAHFYDSPKNFLIELNKRIYPTLDKNMFITLIYGILDIPKRVLTISRAGHNALIHIKQDKSHKIFTPSGIGLGLDSGEVFNREIKETKIKLATNDTLLFFTDGITEAMREDNEVFGEERLLQALLEVKNSNVTKKKKNILNQLDAFLQGSKPQDDITMVLIDCNL